MYFTARQAPQALFFFTIVRAVCMLVVNMYCTCHGCSRYFILLIVCCISSYFVCTCSMVKTTRIPSTSDATKQKNDLYKPTNTGFNHDEVCPFIIVHHVCSYVCMRCNVTAPFRKDPIYHIPKLGPTSPVGDRSEWNGAQACPGHGPMKSVLT